MAEALDENWAIPANNDSSSENESEQEIVENKNEWVEESDDANSDEEDDDQVASDSKKLKRKAKFESFKEKKRQKLEQLKNNTEETMSQLNPSESIQLIESNRPEHLFLSQEMKDKEFSEDNFFYPVLDPSAVTESATKTPCPFIRAFSAGLPSYKKLILGEDISNKKKKNDSDKNEPIVRENGSPFVVIIASSAIRATEIIKSLSAKLIKVKIGKLFAKHFKLTEQIEMLSKEFYPIVIGTPNRISKLIEMGALSLSQAKMVLLDITPDAKSFNLFTLPEVRDDFYKLFYGPIFDSQENLKIALIKDSESNKEKNNKNNDKAKSTYHSKFMSKKKLSGQSKTRTNIVKQKK